MALKLWYKFDEGAGTLVSDSSGNGLHGTFSSAGWAAGRVGPYCGSFGATRSVSVTSDVLNFSGLSEMAITGWINPTAVDAYYRVVERGGEFPTQFSVAIDGPSGKLRSDVKLSSGDSFVVSASAISTNAWTHFALVKSTTQLLMYINGAQSNAISYTGTINNFAGSVCRVGSYTLDDSLKFPGKIDDIRIYDNVLTAAQVSAIYAYRETLDGVSSLYPAWPELHFA